MTRTSQGETAMVPESVGRYRLLESLGPGTFTAHDPEHDRVVTLEVWRSSDDEALAMGRVSHPNVVPVLEVGSDAERVFLATARVRGEDLPLVLRRRRLPVDERIPLFAGIARGLHAVHEAGLASVRFAPHQVIVAPDTQPVLTLSGGHRSATRYMSPEQIAHRPLTPASDQFSFGIALYEALFCRHPFVHTDVASLHTAVLGGHVVPCDGRGVSAHLERVVMRCLEPNPRARFESMHEVAEALEGERHTPPSLMAVVVLSAFAVAVAACVQLA